MDAPLPGIPDEVHIKDTSSDTPTKSAVLTEKQRDYLLGKSDVEKKSPSERALRARLRNRINRSISDLALLHGQIESRDLEVAFSEYGASADESSKLGLHSDGVNALAVMFSAFSQSLKSSNEISVDDMTTDQSQELMSRWIEAALVTMFYEQDKIVKDIDVSITVSFQPSIEELLKREPANIDIQQYERLFQAGEITQEEFYKFVSILFGIDPANSAKMRTKYAGDSAEVEVPDEVELSK